MKAPLLPQLSHYLGMAVSAAFLLASMTCQSAEGQTVINLTTDATVKANATYTYYSRSTASPFTATFYPGPTLHGTSVPTSYKDGTLTDDGTNGAAISFSTGELTAGTTGGIAGWRGVTDANNQFDILIDLKANYVIDRVVIYYQDLSGYRWVTTTDAQQLYTAQTLSGATPTDSDFTLFGSSTASTGVTSTMTLDNAAPIEARYLDLRLAVTASGSSGNYGGVIKGVAIYGYAVPEPNSLALLGISIAPLLGACLLRRRAALSKTQRPL